MSSFITKHMSKTSQTKVNVIGKREGSSGTMYVAIPKELSSDSLYEKVAIFGGDIVEWTINEDTLILKKASK